MTYISFWIVDFIVEIQHFIKKEINIIKTQLIWSKTKKKWQESVRKYIFPQHAPNFRDKRKYRWKETAETAVTQKKCELWSYFSAYGYTSRGVTNQCSFFKVMPGYGFSSQVMFKVI